MYFWWRCKFIFVLFKHISSLNETTNVTHKQALKTDSTIILATVSIRKEISKAIHFGGHMYEYRDPDWEQMWALTTSRDIQLLPEQAEKNMVEHKVGPLSAFVVALCQITTTKKPFNLAQKLIIGADPIINKTILELKDDMGPATLQALLNLMKHLKTLPGQQIYGLTEYTQKLFSHNSSTETDIQEILKEIDDWFTTSDGENLFKKLMVISTFPRNKKTVEEVVQETLDAMILPYRRIKVLHKTKPIMDRIENAVIKRLNSTLTFNY